MSELYKALPQGQPVEKKQRVSPIRREYQREYQRVSPTCFDGEDVYLAKNTFFRLFVVMVFILGFLVVLLLNHYWNVITNDVWDSDTSFIALMVILIAICTLMFIICLRYYANYNKRKCYT